MSANICYPFVLNPTGGNFQSIKLLINHLNADRYDPTIVFGVDDSAAMASRSAGISTDIVSIPQPVHNLIQGETRLLTEIGIGIRLLPYVNDLRRYLLDRKVDLIHVNGGLTAMIWGMAGRLADIPVIWHVRSERSNPWDVIRLRLVDDLIFVAESNKRRFKPKNFDFVDTFVVYNAVDTDVFTPGTTTILHDELGIHSDKPLVGFVGKLVSRKRPMLFVHAGIHAIKKECSAHFVLVGEDQGEFKKEITRLVTQAGYECRFHLLDYRIDIPKIMQALDLLVLTSTEHGEAFPRVPIEAMATGTPVITTDTAGVSEAISDDEHGRIVPCDIEPDQLGAIIKNSLEQPNLLDRWGLNGVERVDSRFTAETHVNEIETIYERHL